MNNTVKICGLSTPESVAVARDGGATHLGFIFFPKSPRNVAPALAGELASQKGGALSVAVTVNADDEFLDQIVENMTPDMLQLHGDESLDRIIEIKTRYGLPLMKAMAVHGPDDLAIAKTYEDLVELLLLDAKPPKGSDLPGGNGVSFEWSILDGLQSKIPVLLSGGIDLQNLEEAISTVTDPTNALIGLDVSSGVESAPGVKDIEKIEAFLTACRSGLARS